VSIELVAPAPRLPLPTFRYNSIQITSQALLLHPLSLLPLHPSSRQRHGHPAAVTLLTLLLITSIMRIFDVYEHPSFEVEQADRATVRATIRRLSVGATVSAIAAISFWGYYWSDSSPPLFLMPHTQDYSSRSIGSNGSVPSTAGPTGIRATYDSVLQGGGF